MTSSYTPNKSIELPGYNDYVDSWNTPVNADFTIIDTALGGVTNLNATSVSGDVTLTSTQYRPLQIVITGTLTANVRYLIPSSVGGQWTVTNSTTGAFTVKIASAAGGSDITLPSGTTMVSCDGTSGGMRLSITSTGVTRVDSFSGGTTGLTPSTATTGAVTLAGTLGVSNGGTGLTAAPVSGQIPIGNGTGYTLAQLTAGGGVTITNGAGSVTISASTVTVPGSNGQIIFNSSGNLGANSNLNWDNVNYRLGIGTASPAVALDVVGAVSTTGAISSSSSITDSKGNVRSIPQNAQTSAYVLVATDAGKHISITTGGVTVNSGIFSTGDAISIYNNSSSSQTITQGSSVTMYLVGTATTGNRTLAQRGLCTVFCVGANTFVISGGGLS
jgi:hypothetical protein